MDKIVTKYISALACVAVILSIYCHELHGQEYTAPAVTISKEKVKVNGKTCYTHIVLEKQTLYSISKAYNVSIDDIYEYNPGLRENGLKKNSIIIIPEAETVDAGNIGNDRQDRQDKKTDKADNSKGSRRGAERNAETKVPDDAKVSEGKTDIGNASDEPEDEKAIIHTVRWYEDLESIAQKYGVSADAIYSANNLKSRDLKSRQKLVIPQGSAVRANGISSGTTSAGTAEEEHATGTAKTTSATSADRTAGTTSHTGTESGSRASSNVNADEYGISGSYASRTRFAGKETNLSLLLPLKANNTKPNSGCFDFYCGALLAARDMGMEGINVNINVKDISATPVNTLGKDFLLGSDIIIGPVSPSDISAVFTSLANAGVDAPYIISPLDPKASSLLASHNTLIQAPSPHTAQYRELAKWITEEYAADDRLIVISEKTNAPSSNVKQLKKAIAETGLPTKEISYNILEGRKIIDSLREQMSKEGTSRIVIASESEAFVNDVLRNLNLLIHESYNIVLYGQSKFRSFDTIEVENFHNTQMRVCLPYYIDYDSPAVMEFVKKFRALFKTEPTQFAFQGYDVTKYFLSIYTEAGEYWIEKMTEGRTDMLQASFDFSESDGKGATSSDRQGNGYENQAVRRVLYGPDYSIKVLKVHGR